MGQEDPKSKKESTKTLEPGTKSFNDHIYEVWKAGNPEEELLKRILRGEVSASLHQEFRNVYGVIREEGNAQRRIDSLRELHQRGKMSAQFFESLTAAIFKEQIENMKGAASAVKEPAKEAKKSVVENGPRSEDPEKETPQKSLSRKEDEERKRAKLVEFLQEADRLLVDYKGDIPQKELQKIRGKLSSLGKDMRIFASSRIGSLLLKEAERKDTTEEERKNSKERFLSRMEILLGVKDQERLKTAYELYQIILSKREALGKIDPLLKSRFNEQPFFNLSNQEQIWDLALLIGDTDETLTPEEKRRILSLVEPLEEFLEKVGHDELKEKIKAAKLRRIEELKLWPAVKKVVEVRGELTREFTPERTLVGLEEHQREVKQKIDLALDSLVREGAPSLVNNPGYAKRVISEIILFSHVAEALKREFQGFRGEEIPTEETGSESVRHSPIYFDNIIRKKEKELESAEMSGMAEDEASKLQIMRAIMSRLKQQKNYLEKLKIALIAGFIHEEDYNQFLIFNEAHAVVAELKAKNKEGEAADLADSDKEGQLNIINERLKEANKLYKEAEYVRQGDLEKANEIAQK